jgi:phospholipid transport system substrate-binding protein
MMTLRHAVLALIIVAISAAAPARAEESAGQWISDLGTRVVKVLETTSDLPDQRKDELEQIFVQSFDVDFVAQFVIGRFWRKTSPEERTEFMTVLPDYVATIYAGLFAGYEGDGFRVTKESPRDDGSYVQGLILRDGGPDVAAAFTVSRPDGRYRIKDASVEGVSLLVTKRSEFGSVIAREGMEGLIARIRKILRS